MQEVRGAFSMELAPKNYYFFLENFGTLIPAIQAPSVYLQYGSFFNRNYTV